MDLASKKLTILEMIMSIKDEFLLDKISDKIKPLVASKPEKGSMEKGLLKKYEAKIKSVLVLNDVIKEQNFNGIDKAKMRRLAKEADIQEPIDELLAMI